MSDNPFDSIDPLVGATGVSSSANPYDAIDPMETGQPSSSVTGAFARSAAKNAIPAAGGLLGAARGAEIGAGLGALVPGLGETGISELVGGVGGALVGGLGGSYLTGKAQDVAIEHAPEKWRDPLEAQERVDTELHPTATFAGGLAPYALTMNPFAAAKGAAAALPENASTLMRLMSHPVTGRLLSGGLMGGMELSQEALQGNIDPSNIAIATAFGTVFTKPNKFGEAISNVGSRFTDFHPKTAPPPTVIQGDAAGITGAGANADTFEGTHERPPELQREAERREVEEKEVLGTASEPQPDLRAIARRMEPELFDKADTLDGHSASLKAQLDAMSNPTDAMMNEAQARKTELDAQLAAHVEGRNGYSGGPEARRLRAMSRAAQSDMDDLQARRDAFANGEATDTPEMAAVRQQLLDVRQQRMDLGRDVAAAMRRAADRANGETVEAEPVEAVAPAAPAPVTETPQTIETPASEPAAPRIAPAKDMTSDQIEEDVRRQLFALGVPFDQANSRAKVEAAFFSTLADRSQGKFGTAGELYAKHGPIWRGKGRQAVATTPEAPTPGSAGEPLFVGGEELKGPVAEKMRAVMKRGEPVSDAEMDRAATAPTGAERPADMWRRFQDAQQERTPSTTPGGGFNGNRSRNGLLIRKKASQSWEAGNIVDAGFTKNLLVVAKGEDGAFTLLSEPNNAGVSRRYSMRPHEGLAKDGETDFVEATKGLAPTGATELAQSAKGKIVLADNRRPIITLFKDADFSTLVHEGAHNYLDILSQYADRPEAPDDLKADWQTTKDWLKVGADGQIKTSHHEKFARGFEQYIREGVAPSKPLARVFGQMKQWMVSIYRTLRGLGEPISDDIRGVFDRMLAETPERTVIAPEEAGGPTLADIHEADAEHTEPAQADPVADRAAAEKAQTVAKPPQDIAHEAAPVAAGSPAAAKAAALAGGEAGAGAGGNGILDKGPLNAGAERQGDGVGVGRGANEPGRGQAAPESPRAPAGDASGPAGAGTSAPRPDPGHPLAGQPQPILSGAKSKFIDDKAGNIRLDNIPDRIKLDDIKGALATDADPEAVVEQAIREVKDVLRKTAADNGGFIDDRRGKVSDEQTKREALQILGREPDRVLTKKIGEAFSSAEATAIQMMAARAAMDVRAKDMAVTAAQYGTPEHVQALAEAERAKDFMALVQAKYAQATAEGGRTLRALRKLPEIWNPSTETADDFMKRQTGRTLFQSAMDAKLRNGFDSQQQIAAYINDSGRYSFGRMILEYWINGLISGFATHTTYAVGNALLAANKIFLETPTAVAIGALRHTMGDTGPVVPWEEAKGQIGGVGRGLAPAIKASADALRTGLTTRLPGEEMSGLTAYQALNVGRPAFVSGASLDEAASMRDAMGAWYGVGRGMKDGLLSIGALLKAGGVEGAPTWDWEFSTRGVIPNLQYKGVTVAPIGDLARGPGRFIAAIHSFFRSINYSIEINGSEYRQAASEGLSGDMMARRIAELRNERTPDRISEAMAANMPLFHVGEPPTDPLLARLSDARNAATQQTLMGQGGELTRKVAALTNWTPKIPGLGETPILKFIDPFVTISANVIDQSLVQRTPLGFLSGEMRADLLGRNGGLARDKAAARMLVGSVLASTFGILAAEGYVTGAGPQDPQKGSLWRMAYQPHSVLLGDEWVDLHRLGPLGMLLGMSADLYDVAHTAQKEDLLTASAHLQHAIAQNVLDESFMRGPAELIKAIEDKNYSAVYMRNFVSSFVPYSVGVAQWARASDPYSRQARTLIDAIKAKVPGMSEDLLPRRTIFGDAMPHREAFAGANGLLSIWQQKVNSDPVVSEMLRVGFSPKMPGQRINNVKLSDDEYDDFAKMAGRLAKQRLDTYVHSSSWARVPDPQKADLMRQIFSDSRHIAEQAIKAKYPHIGSDAYILKNTRMNGPRESIE